MRPSPLPASSPRYVSPHLLAAVHLPAASPLKTQKCCLDSLGLRRTCVHVNLADDGILFRDQH